MHLAVARLIVKRFPGLLHVQLAQVAIGIAAVIVPHAIGDIARLLDLDKQIAGTDGVDLSSRDVERVARPGLDSIDRLKERAVGHATVKLGLRQAAIESCADDCSRLGLQDIPHLVLAHAAVAAHRHLVARVHLHREVATGVDQLDEQRETVSIAAIHVTPHQVSAIAPHQPCQRKALVLALRHDRLAPGHRREFPTLADRFALSR